MEIPEIKINNRVIKFKLTVGNMIRLKKEIGRNPLDAILKLYNESDQLKDGNVNTLDIDEELMFATLYYASQYDSKQKMTREKFEQLIQDFLDEEVVTETEDEIITEYRSIFTDILPIFLEVATQCGYIPKDRKVVKKEKN